MNIFVTGAAGLLGGALVAELLHRGHAVVALVHRQPDIRGNDGEAAAGQIYDGSPPLAGVAIMLQGDISAPGLGIEPATQTWLDRHIDLVIHCAALVKFEAATADLEAVNVSGTRNVIGLFPNARIIYVSTAYVCGLKDGPVAEAECNPNDIFGNGYEQSKAHAENIVRQTRPDAIIARPSIIVGEAASGRIRSFDNIYRAFKFIAEGKIKSVPVSPLATLNFVPIDHVVAGICGLAENEGAISAIVHLAARKSISATRFLSLIGEVPGLYCPEITSPDAQNIAAITIADRLAQPYWVYFSRFPEFETLALRHLTGLQAPDIDDAAIARQIQFCVDAGFIRRDRK